MVDCLFAKLVGTGLDYISETNVMNDKEPDPNLQSPQEANTTKHINFLETEEAGDTSTSGGTDNNDSPTKKAWEELRNDNKKQQNAQE